MSVQMPAPTAVAFLTPCAITITAAARLQVSCPLDVRPVGVLPDLFLVFRVSKRRVPIRGTTWVRGDSMRIRNGNRMISIASASLPRGLVVEG